MSDEELQEKVTELTVMSQENVVKLSKVVLDTSQQHRECVMAIMDELRHARNERDELRQSYDAKVKEFIESTKHLIDSYERRLDRQAKRCDSLLQQIDVLRSQISWENQQLTKLIQLNIDRAAPSVMLNTIK